MQCPARLDGRPRLGKRFVDATAERLESDHDAFLLAGEWRLALGAA